MRTSKKTRRDVSDTTKATRQSSWQERRDVTRQERHGADEMEYADTIAEEV